MVPGSGTGGGMSSSKPKSAAEEERQKHRDKQGKYASYVAGTSAADELCGDR